MNSPRLVLVSSILLTFAISCPAQIQPESLKAARVKSAASMVKFKKFTISDASVRESIELLRGLTRANSPQKPVNFLLVPPKDESSLPKISIRAHTINAFEAARIIALKSRMRLEISAYAIKFMPADRHAFAQELGSSSQRFEPIIQSRMQAMKVPEMVGTNSSIEDLANELTIISELQGSGMEGLNVIAIPNPGGKPLPEITFDMRGSSLHDLVKVVATLGSLQVGYESFGVVLYQ